MRTFATPARIATLLAALVLLAAAPAGAKPTERRVYFDIIEASTMLWNAENKFGENHHPNYVADDDPATAWIAGAKSSGAGGWLRFELDRRSYDWTTRVRLRVRNGYQRSKDRWKANARAKEVTVRLPDKIAKTVTLADTDGWQEIVVDQPRGPMSELELVIGSVYEGARSADLAISDIQIFITSEDTEYPAQEKAKLADLMKWKHARLAAAKAFPARQAELPIYPAYEVQQVRQRTVEGWPIGDHLLDLAVQDPGFAKEWKDALAAAMALEQGLGSMTRVQLAPKSQTRLVEVHGLQIGGIFDSITEDGTPPKRDAIRLPMLGLASAMFADQLRAGDVKTGQTIPQYQHAPKGGCSADVAWVARTQPKEGPSRVAAIAVGRCRQLRGRGADLYHYLGTKIELMIYDSTGKLVLVSGNGHLEGYRWTMEGGKPMLAGGRSMLPDGRILEARLPTPASTP